MPNVKPLAGAVIGLGNIATRGHLPGYLFSGYASDALKIVAVLDVVDTQRAAIAAMLPEARFYTDLEKMLSAEKLDFVDICTPPHTHAKYVERCAQAGMHILCEKPLTENVATISEVVQAINGKNLVFVPCHQYKYSPLWSKVKEVIDDGSLGEVTFAQFNVFRLQADTGSAAWNPTWRTEKKHSGGGILVDTGAHYLYLAQYFFGLPKRVCGILRTLKHAEYGVEDTAAVTLDYGDKLMQINLTWAAGERMNGMSIAGTKGTLTYDGSRMILSSPAGATEIPMPNVADKNQYIEWYAKLFAEFAGRVQSRNFNTDLLDEAVNVMKLLALSSKSSETAATLPWA
jgi:predicted dehydrogenase